MTGFNKGSFDNLVACRDILAFALTDQDQPPADLIQPISAMVDLLFRRVDELRLEHGFDDPDVTIHDPRRASPDDGQP